MVEDEAHKQEKRLKKGRINHKALSAKTAESECVINANRWNFFKCED